MTRPESQLEFNMLVLSLAERVAVLEEEAGRVKDFLIEQYPAFFAGEVGTIVDPELHDIDLGVHVAPLGN